MTPKKFYHQAFAMKTHKTILFLFIFIFPLKLLSQPSCHFEHYSTENGLPQYTIMDILQDRKGFMWFATWDGFSKYDGHSFKNYKVQSGDTYYMRSNRIEQMREDAYGNIWLLSYDKEAHRFNPANESFKGVGSIPEYKNKLFQISKLEAKPSGKVWLLSEKEGCICIMDSLFNSQIYNIDNNRIKGNIVYNIFEDSDENSWLLTNNGISFIKKGEIEPISYFFDNNKAEGAQSFYSAIETGDIIWFGSNNGRIWKYTKSSSKFDLHEIPSKSELTEFMKVSENELFLSTSNDGFFLFDINTKDLTHYNSSTNPELKSNKVHMLFFDSLEQLWFETDELGIYKFDKKKRTINYYFVKTEDVAISVFPPVAKIIEDIYSEIWVHPRGGGFSYYDKEKDNLVPFYNDESKTDWKFSNILHAVYSDKQGNLWLSTRSHGLEKAIFDGNYFKTLRINPEIKVSIANEVRAVFQDDEHNIWIATKNRQLTIYDENYNRIGNFSNDGTIRAKQLFPGAIYSMMQDEAGNIWIGTKGAGLFKVRKSDRQGKYHVEQFRKNPNDIFSLSEDVIYSIYQDSKKNIWIGTYGGGLNLVKTTEKGETVFINHRNNLKNYPIETGYRIRFISENKYGNVAVGTTSGLIMFSSEFAQPDDINYYYYTREPGEKASLANNDIHGIHTSKKGDTYLATFGGGLNKISAYDEKGFPTAFRAYTVQDGLPADVCLAVLEDDEQGYLWVSMENNLSKFNPEKEVFETFADIKRIMSVSNFSEASAYRLKNNELIFGFSNGILHFDPEDIKNNQFKSQIVLSDFRIFNQSVSIADENSPLNKNIDDVENLTLTHKQNFFSIEYAALDFASPDNILYAYKLDGFDQDWVYAQKQRIANYTNIPKGEYVFRVKSTNSEGAWIDNERSLPIKVLPSFWETPWAYMLYLVLIFALFYIALKILFSFYQLKQNVEIEKQLSEMKLRFFTDISHEIRTPLTMISAPINYLIEEEDTPVKVKKQLNLISQNTNRLLRLVNQILDFRKVQQFHLKIQETDLGIVAESICHNFDELAKENNIDFKFINQAKGEKIWVDRDCLEKIIMNLLSNAFKYTAKGELIQLSVFGNEKFLSVEVKDKGKGISKEKQKSLFTRFASFNEDKSKPSTGIGLFIVKDLINKHNGKIDLESELGKGSTFTVSFQKGLNHFNDSDVEIVATNAESGNIGTEILSGSENISEEKNEETLDNRKTILIVEDDQDLRGFIKTILEKEHKIIEASDGIEGLEQVEKHQPDFIVSDIMMPHMDGIEFLQKLRENINTSHIPIILLTAKATIESKLEGLEYGADDYITKPFSVPYFRARINNLLERRKHLQEVYLAHLTSNSALKFEPQAFVITSHDETLMKEVIKIIEENMDNSDFSVEDLSTSVGMSRSVFFNKIKSLTGFAPLEFIRDIKMKRAAQLLSSGEFMVKEVSFMIGISDTKYFGKCFKTKYGMTPQEYKNQFSNKF